MKIIVHCDSGANIHSRKEDTIDLEKDWSISDEEWKAMTEDEKFEQVMDWANNHLDIGWEEVK